MIYIDEINGILLKKIGTILLSGAEELLTYPERKEVIENDWAEENGGEYDLDNPKYKDKEVTLKFGILASNDVEFWKHYEALFKELSKPEFQRLYVGDHSRHYAVFYKKSSDFKKTRKRLRGIDKVFVKFDITFKVAYNNELITKDYTYNSGVLTNIHYSKGNASPIVKGVASLIAKNEPVELTDNRPIMLSYNTYQPNIDGYISGRRSKFIVLEGVSSQTIRRHLSKCQKKKAETIVLIANESNKMLWKNAIKEALIYVSKYFNPDFRILFSDKTKYWEY